MNIMFGPMLFAYYFDGVRSYFTCCTRVSEWMAFTINIIVTVSASCILVFWADLGGSGFWYGICIG